MYTNSRIDLTAAVARWAAGKKDRPVYPAKNDPPGPTPKPTNSPPQKDTGPQPIPLRKKGATAQIVLGGAASPAASRGSHAAVDPLIETQAAAAVAEANRPAALREQFGKSADTYNREQGLIDLAST